MMKENKEEEEINQKQDPILEEISANLFRLIYSDNEENISSQLTANSQVGSVPPAVLQGQYQSSQGESSREGQLTNNVVTQVRHRAYTPTHRALLEDNFPPGLIQTGYILQRPVQPSRILSHQQVYGQVGYRPPLQVNSATEQQERQEEEDVIEEENELPVVSFQEIGANLPWPRRFPSHSSSPPSDYEENISSHLAAAYILFGSIPCLVQPAQYHSSRDGSGWEGDQVNVIVTKDFIITSVPPAEPRLCLPRQQSTVCDSYIQTPDGLQSPPLRQQGSGLLPVVAAAEDQALMSQWQRADQIAYRTTLQAFLGHYMPLALIQSGYTLPDSLILSHQQLYGRFGYRPPLQIDSAQPPPPPFSQPSPAPPGNIFTHTDIPPECLERYYEMSSMNFAQIPSPFLQPSLAPPANIFTHMDVPPERLERYNQMSSSNFAEIPPPFSQQSPAPPGNIYTHTDRPPERLEIYNQMGAMNFAQIPSPFQQPSTAPPVTIFSYTDVPPELLECCNQMGSTNFAHIPSLPQPSSAPPGNIFTYTDIPPERYNHMGSMNFAEIPPPFPQPSPAPPANIFTYTDIPPEHLERYNQMGSMNFAQIPPALPTFRQHHPAPLGYSTCMWNTFTACDNTYVGMPPLLGDYDADGGETDGRSSTNVRRADHSER